MSPFLATFRATAGVGIVRARGQFATRAPSTASVNERERVSDVMSASNGRTIGASERAALLGTDANTQDRATDDGDEEAWERSLVEAPRRSFGARAAVVTVATLACGAFAAIASTHATGGEVSLFASALGSTRGERIAARRARLAKTSGDGHESADVADLGFADAPKTYIIADTEPSDDKNRAQVAYNYIVDSFKSAKLGAFQAHALVEFVQAVYPTRWPKTLNAARDAVAGMMDGDDRRFPVMDVKAALADKDHRCVTGACKAGLNHHLGCALSHMAVWKKGLDSGAQTFVTWESDGMGIHAVHPLDYAELARQVPKDADMIWLTDLAHRGSGQFVKKFRSQSAGKWAKRTHGGDMATLTSSLGESTVNVNQTANVYIHKFNKICGWAGAGAIMWTRSGAQRLRDYVNEHGAGMIDAWLAGQCINHRPGGFNLNCYAAQSRPVLKEHVGGYLPDWYYDESQTGEMPQHMIDEMDVNIDKYNRLGCERGGDAFRKQAFAPMGWPDVQGDEFDRTVKNCIAPHGSIDPCNEHYPRGRSEVESMREKIRTEEKKNPPRIPSLASTEISMEDRNLLFNDPDEFLPVQLSTY